MLEPLPAPAAEMGLPAEPPMTGAVPPVCGVAPPVATRLLVPAAPTVAPPPATVNAPPPPPAPPTAGAEPAMPRRPAAPATVAKLVVPPLPDPAAGNTLLAVLPAAWLRPPPPAAPPRPADSDLSSEEQPMTDAAHHIRMARRFCPIVFMQSFPFGPMARGIGNYAAGKCSSLQRVRFAGRRIVFLASRTWSYGWLDPRGQQRTDYP